MAKKDPAKQPEQDNKTINKLEETIVSLEKKLAEKEDIVKRAQSDYIRLKLDMDALIQRTQEQQKTTKTDAVVKVGKELLPLIGQIKHTVGSMDDATKDTARGKSMQLVYDKMISSLQQLHIRPIQSNTGDEPDIAKHIPISTQEAPKKALQGKILSEMEQGYIYDHDGVETVITPAKVIIGI